MALCGTDTKCFWELLTAYFGANHTGKEEDLWDFIDAAPEIPRPLPLTDTETEDKDKAGSTVSAPATIPASGALVGVGAKVKGASQRKSTIPTKKDDMSNVCELSKAILMYPASEKTVKETGVPINLQVHREQATTHVGASVYLCQHELCSATSYFAQNPSLLYSHVHRKYLGICLACLYCSNKLYWNSHGWHSHMEAHHQSMPHYGHALADEAHEARKVLSSQGAKPQAPEIQESQHLTTKEVSPDDSEDSSSDFDSSHMSTQEEEEPSASQRDPYTSQQKKYVKRRSLCPQRPTLFGVPHALPPQLDTTYHQCGGHARSLCPSPRAQLLAEQIVAGDILPEEDMPELEETPPPTFPSKK